MKTSLRQNVVRQRTLMALTLTVFGSSAAYAAGHHQICYQGPPVNSKSSVVVHCRSDLGVGCSATLPGGTPIGMPLISNQGYVRTFTVEMSAIFTARVEFGDGKVRRCSTSVVTGGFAHAASASGPTPPQLVGYTTDASGLLMTGVWSSSTTVARSTVTGSPVAQTNSISVPGDFVAVGGGGVGTNVPNGALLTQTERKESKELSRQWFVSTQDTPEFPQLHNNQTVVIGMKIEGLALAELTPLIKVNAVESAVVTNHPRAEVIPPQGHVVLGGGALSRSHTSTQFGQFLTMSAPVPIIMGFCWQGRCGEDSGAIGWQAESKDHITPAPGRVIASVVSMPDQITVNGQLFRVEQYARGVTSPVAAHPSIMVSGMSGQFALTGVGARANWTPPQAGSLLWQLLPRPDLAGVQASSKDHGWSSPASITGYTIGVRLVPE
jgi:vibriolysin